MLIQALPNLTFIECQMIESRLAAKGVPLRLKRANSAIQFSEGKMLRRKGMVVPYRTKSWLTVRARAVRENTGFANFRRIDVLGLVENFLDDYWPGSRFDVLPAAELGEVEAIAYPFESRIVVSDEIYLRAFHGDGHARFTIAHEIAHMLLHRVNISGERHLLGPNETYSEWQADYFAAQLLVPEHMFGQLLEPNYIAKEFGVSRAAATVALKQFNRRRKLAS